jgi:ribonuclease BN (tRNA processing enzyme)
MLDKELGKEYPEEKREQFLKDNCDDILDGRLERDEINLQMYQRIINSHMSLSTAKRILKSNDLSQVDNIVLIHLSNGSSDEQRFVDEITRLTGKQVTAADKGMEIELLIPY